MDNLRSWGVSYNNREYETIENYTESITYKIVVARYNENIDWLLPKEKNIIVYNKGPIPNKNIYKMPYKHFLKSVPNLGRESHTYLHYVIENYYNLPDIVLFTQGDTSDHKIKNDVNIIDTMINEAKMYGKSIPSKFKGKNKWLTPYWNQSVTSGGCIPINPDNHWKSMKYENNQFIVFHDWFVKYIQPEFPNENDYAVYTNGLFAVKKEIILKNSIDFYKKLIKRLVHSSDPVEGHFFERSWYYIFK
jgi:hypothetical protein